MTGMTPSGEACRTCPEQIRYGLGLHLMNVWVVKSTLNRRDGSKGWHWDNYLPVDDACDYDPGETAADWGGAGWVRSPLSKKLIREEVRKGDIVVCYQSDGREILGLTTMASDGKDDPPGSGDFNMFDLAPPSEALVLDPPLTIASLYAAGCRPKCFGPGMQGTVFRIEQGEFEQMLGVLRAEMTADARHDLDRWLRGVGWQRSRCAPRRR